ncbi:hypothetical protein LBMAG49_12000 [Planctomycetota bacterium]|nr:hypothetical protein LBMAG49_12000 [Planctomycetota bacterium]
MITLPASVLRVLLITDGLGDAPRLLRIVRAGLQAGVRAVQVREPLWSARELIAFADCLRPEVAAVRGILLVNDRCDVVAAGHADGVQCGFRSLSPAAARKVVGKDRLVGYSAHDGAQIAEAAAAGCDFALLSPVWPSSSKPGAKPLGVERAVLLTRAATLPLLWLGGVSVERVAQLALLPTKHRPIGVAVRGGICEATDPHKAALSYVSAAALVFCQQS